MGATGLIPFCVSWEFLFSDTRSGSNFTSLSSFLLFSWHRSFFSRIFRCSASKSRLKLCRFFAQVSALLRLAICNLSSTSFSVWPGFRKQLYYPSLANGNERGGERERFLTCSTCSWSALFLSVSKERTAVTSFLTVASAATAAS